MNRLIRIVVALVAVLALTAPVAAAQAPIVLAFEKAVAGPGYFTGTVEGGGTIEMTVTAFEVRGTTGHITATLELTETSAGTLTAVVSGPLNFATGRAVLNGAILDGDHEGAQVHEESRLVNPLTEAYVGTVQIMPAR